MSFDCMALLKLSIVHQLVILSILRCDYMNVLLDPGISHSRFRVEVEGKVGGDGKEAIFVRGERKVQDRGTRKGRDERLEGS